MEHKHNITIDSLPGDVWRLICEQFETLTDLQSVLLVNKSCNNYCKYNIEREKLWHQKLKRRLGMRDTNIYSLILPSKLLQLLQKQRPSLKLVKESYDLNKPIKIVIVGNGKSGQTTFMRLISGNPQIGTLATTYGSEQCEFVVKSPNRTFIINLWDIGLTKAGFIRDAYHQGAYGAIAFCDVNDRLSRKSVMTWARDARHRLGIEVPIAVCMNKVDLPFSERISRKEILRELPSKLKLTKSKNIMFCEISNWAKYNVHEPLIWIMQQLTGDDTLELTFPAMTDEMNSTVNSEIVRAGIEARLKMQNEPDDKE